MNTAGLGAIPLLGLGLMIAGAVRGSNRMMFWGLGLLVVPPIVVGVALARTPETVAK